MYVLKEGDGERKLGIDFDEEVACLIEMPRNIKFEVLKLKTSRKNSIAAFLFIHPKAKYTLIVSHGNATDGGAMWMRYVELCRELHVNVLGYDYSGYGQSTGTPSESNTYSDLNAAYDYLVVSGRCPNPEKQIILYGQSVGSGPSCKLASRRKRPVRGLILHSPIMSGLRVVAKNRGPLCCFDIYPNINRIRNVKCPVFIIHGDEDEQVGFRHGVGLQEAVPEQYKTEPWWVKGGGHNDIVFNNYKEFFSRLKSYVSNLERADNKDSSDSFQSAKYPGLSDTLL